MINDIRRQMRRYGCVEIRIYVWLSMEFERHKIYDPICVPTPPQERPPGFGQCVKNLNHLNTPEYTIYPIIICGYRWLYHELQPWWKVVKLTLSPRLAIICYHVWGSAIKSPQLILVAATFPRPSQYPLKKGTLKVPKLGKVWLRAHKIGAIWVCSGHWPSQYR